MGESFSWGKFFGGLFDPTAYFKTLAIVLRVSIVIVIAWGIWIGGTFIQNKLAPKKQQPAVFTVSDQLGGSVKNSADQKETKFGILNF